MGICIRHFSCLAHKILQVLPATAAGQVLHNEAVLSTDRGPILIPARATPAAAATAAVSTTTFKQKGKAKLQNRKGKATQVTGPFEHLPTTTNVEPHWDYYEAFFNKKYFKIAIGFSF